MNGWLLVFSVSEFTQNYCTVLPVLRYKCLKEFPIVKAFSQYYGTFSLKT
jgi:hypothetical protein